MNDVTGSDVKSMSAPAIDTSVDGIVVVDNVPPRLVVRVEPYAGMAGGDEVQLRWDTGVLRTSRIGKYVVDAAKVGKSTFFVVPRPTTGPVRVSYLVGRSSGEWAASKRLDITVRA